MKLELGFMRHDLNNSRETQDIVDFAIAHGQPYFESCYFYLDFKCEEFIYKALEKYDRSQYEICGKMPVHSILENSTAEDIFQEQLKKVPGGFFDIYLLQALDEATFPILSTKKAISYLLKQKQLGKIKRFGISIQCVPETFEKYLQLGCWDIVQMPLNYYDWFACRGEELYKLAVAYDLPIIAQAPMKGGLLKHINKYGDPSQQALSFIRQLNNVEYVLTGCSKLTSYIDTYNKLFESECLDITLNQYKEELQEYLDTTHINCIRCNNCYNCNKHLPINTLIYLYNKCIDLSDEHHVAYFNSFDALKKNIIEPANVCGRCNDCCFSCPSKVDIKKVVKDMFEMRS